LFILSLTVFAQPKLGKPAYVVTYEESRKSVSAGIGVLKSALTVPVDSVTTKY
jgi:hypothetical protein